MEISHSLFSSNNLFVRRATKYTDNNKGNKILQKFFFFIAKVRQMFSSSEGSADKMAYTRQLLNDMRYQ